MTTPTSPLEATLLDVLIDGFEKNEILEGFHWRTLPLPDADAAARKFAAFIEEAQRWKGQPSRLEDTPTRRIGSWPNLEIRQVGRAVLIRVRTPRFHEWWHDPKTWEDDPLERVIDSIEQERRPTLS